MRQYGFFIDAPFKNGLYRTSVEPLNGPYLSVCKGLKPSADGLVCHSDVTHVWTVTDWPNPQYIRSEYWKLLMDSSTIYTVNETNFSTTPLAVNGSLSQTQNMWTHTSFGRAFIATNYANLLVHYPSSSQWYVYQTPSVYSLCKWDDRLVLGGIYASSWFSGDGAPLVELLRMYQGWSSNISPSSNTVVVGAKYGGSVPNTMLEELAFLGLPSQSNIEYAKDAIKALRLRAINIDLPGIVYNVVPMVDKLIVYTSGGIAAIVEDNNGRLRQIQVSRHVLGSRTSVCSYSGSHYFVDRSGSLHVLLPDLTIKRIGYSAFLQDATNTAGCLMTANDHSGEIIIGDSSNCYEFGESGLSERNYRYSSINQVVSYLVGTASGSQTSSFTATMCYTDLGIRSIKRLDVIEVIGQNMSGLRVKVDYGYNYSVTLADGGWIEANSDGVVFPLISGVVFRVSISGTSYSDTVISGINVRWQSSDKRYKRGLYYANQTASQSGV